jgi:drug/metabolite transporter (DMT)-like permease
MFMKIAVDTFTPSVIVFGRAIIGAALLIPIALKQGGVREIIKGWKYVIPYAAAEMIGPWYLISSAEKNISSGLAGLLVATVPIWSTIFASINGDKTVWHSTRLFGLVFGFAGLVALVGIESITGNSSLTSIFMVLLAAVLYAYAVNMITQRLPGVSGIALNGVAMAISAVFFAPFAYVQWPQTAIPMNAIWSVIGLGVLCTALAFVLFFKVMADIGPARASLVTYINTAFAVLLGVIILSEPITLGIMVGLPMVLVGSYFASRKPTVNV